jgi:hypothetical protein
MARKKTTFYIEEDTSEALASSPPRRENVTRTSYKRRFGATSASTCSTACGDTAADEACELYVPGVLDLDLRGRKLEPQCRRFSASAKLVLKRGTILTTWLEQAKRQSITERRPWLLVVAGHGDRAPAATLDFRLFTEIATEAGRIPKGAASRGRDPHQLDLREAVAP